MIQASNAAWRGSANPCTYLYDPLGQRKQKTVGVGSPMPVTTQFVLAGGQEIGDYYAGSATWQLTVRGARHPSDSEGGESAEKVKRKIR